MTLWRKITTISILFPILLTGCWDIKDTQDINYLTSIGFDYVDNQYIVYAQLLDFTSVAKMESGKPTEQVPVWVGHGKGETVRSAVNNLYHSSQLRIFYGHINAIVVSENVLKKGLKEVNELQQRYYEMRYTPWIFGTREPIDKLFAVNPFFNLSPMMSLLHQPQESYKQESHITPLTSREFVSDIHEPGKATTLPSLSITDGHWNKEREPHSMLEMNGVFVFQDGKYQGWLSAKGVRGLRWVEPKTNRSPIIIRSGEEPQAALSLKNPKVEITPKIQNGKVYFSVDVKLFGTISEILQPISESLLEQKASELVQDEIKNTYRNGLKINSDLLQLEHALYRQKNKEWKKINSGSGFKLASKSLNEIKVSVKLDNAGKLKLP